MSIIDDIFSSKAKQSRVSAQNYAADILDCIYKLRELDDIAKKSTLVTKQTDSDTKISTNKITLVDKKMVITMVFDCYSDVPVSAEIKEV